MLRHIAWFSGAPISPDATGRLTSPDAVVNSRVLTPAQDIEKLNIACSIFGNLEEAEAADVTNHLQKLGVDIVVIGKISSEGMVRLARAAKHLGCYVLVDFGADISALPALNDMTSLIDMAVASTPELAESITKQSGITAAVIMDIDPDDNVLKARKDNAKLWVECFKYLKQKPPACANMNSPPTAQD